MASLGATPGPGNQIGGPPADGSAAACKQAKWSITDGTWVIVLAVLTLIIGYAPAVFYFGPHTHNVHAASAGLGRVICWVLVMLTMTCLLVVIGRGICGRSAGVFIDSRNYISLSRVQMALWTIVVLSAFISAAFFNMAIGKNPGPSAGAAPAIATMFDIGIPQTLWSAMGISVASLIGTPFLLSQKALKGASGDEVESTMTAMTEPNAVMNHTGQVLNKACPENASLDDLFRGDETGNGDHVDLAKVQMFIFTLILVGGYALAVGSEFYNMGGKSVPQLPDLSSGFVTLMLISHGGYLSNKAVNHSQKGDAMSKADWSSTGATSS